MLTIDDSPPRDVFVVEDIPETVQGLLRELNYRGANPHRAGSRVGAEATLRENQFAAILIDLNIPAEAGGTPSPEEGKRLIQAILDGSLGDQHARTPCFIITAQSIETDAETLARHERFGGVFSKMGDSRWLLQKLADQGVINEDDELDIGVDLEPVYARIQLLAVEVLAHATVVLQAVDLEYEKIHLSLDRLTPALRKRIIEGRLPVLLEATANVVATSENDLELADFVIAEHQVDLVAELDVPWLR